MTAGDSLLGQELDEYRLEAVLGRGGMARVYRGLDTRLERYAAIKVIDTPLRTTPEYVLRFEREAQAIARLEHPHIVRLYRYSEAQGVWYMAMQYVEGADLGSVLQTYRDDSEFIEPEEARRIIREVCLALDYAHSKGVIHRDVKPSNILLDKQGEVYLTDFGLALLTELGTQGTIFGSPHYIAPEQAISSAAVVPQSDLYSIGVILYEMFTGHPPFDAATPLDIAMMHMIDPPMPPHQVRPEISLSLENVILKALAKEPGERYASGAALADALDQALAHPEAKALTPIATTLPRKSIPERVALDVSAHSLPPLPAEVATLRQVLAQPSSPDEPILTAPASIVRSRVTIPTYAVGIGLLVLGLVALVFGLIVFLSGHNNGESTSSLPIETRGVTAPVAADATQTPPPTAMKSPTVTILQSVQSTEKAAPTEQISAYTILFAKHGNDSLFVVNQSSAALPLAPLQLGEGQAAIKGTDWGVDTLEPGQCVGVWKDKGNPQPPKVDCILVGTRLTRVGQGRFWISAFKITYGQQIETTCDTDWCSIVLYQ